MGLDENLPHMQAKLDFEPQEEAPIFDCHFRWILWASVFCILGLSLTYTEGIRLGTEPPPIWLAMGFQLHYVLIALYGVGLSLYYKRTVISERGFRFSQWLILLWPYWIAQAIGLLILRAAELSLDIFKQDPWALFSQLTFPLFAGASNFTFQWDNCTWFITLLLVLSAFFPFISKLLDRWGSQRVILVVLALSLLFRFLISYRFGAQPPYSPLNGTRTPTLNFLSHLGLFTVAVASAQKIFLASVNPKLFRWGRLIFLGTVLSLAGAALLFIPEGWILSELLLPLGILWIFAGLGEHFSVVEMKHHGSSIFTLRALYMALVLLGPSSWFAVEVAKLLGQDSLPLTVSLSLLTALFISVIASALYPAIRRITRGLWRNTNELLTQHKRPAVEWVPNTGQKVRYLGRSGWHVELVESLLDESPFYLCQITNGARKAWVLATDLEPEPT